MLSDVPDRVEDVLLRGRGAAGIGIVEGAAEVWNHDEPIALLGLGFDDGLPLRVIDAPRVQEHGE